MNRRGVEIDGVQAYRSIAEIDDRVDAAILLIPAEHCPQAIRELGALGTRAVVVAVSGFAELGTDEGRRLQDEIVDAAYAHGIRLVGPNCNGVYDTRRPLSLGYNYLHGLKVPPGGVALLSHSGAIGGTAYELIAPFGASLSHFVSCGNEADLQLLDYAEYLVEDPAVEVFALILDAVEDGPRFRRFARRARELGKPILAMKLGNSDLAREATLAHSSRLSGAKDVYDAVFYDDGVVLVPTLESLMITAGLASVGRSTERSGIVVTSPSGGGAISLTDALNRQEVELAPLDEATVEDMRPSSGFATVMNPFDLGAGTSKNAHLNVPALAAADGVGAIAFVVTILQTEAGMLRYASAFAETQERFPDLATVVAAIAPLRPIEEKVYRGARIPVVRSTS
ncbi:MAG: CoA-binding protein, partial [Actinomycetota bacterium]